MATQQYINYGNTANDGTGDPLRDAFIKVDNNFTSLWASGPVASNITITNNTIGVTDTNGNLVLSPNGVGIIQTKNNIVPSIGNVYNLGSSSLYYRSAYLGPGGVYSTGNITTTGYLIGDGSQISNISITAGSEIVNGTSNVRVAASGNVTVGIAGTNNVATFATTGLEVVGNITANYFAGNGKALTSTLTDKGNDTNNWDTLTEMGVYKVNRASWGGTTGTPVDSTVFVGVLQVITASGATTQMFFPGTIGDANNVKIQWNRSLWNGTWTAWIRIVNNGQTIDAGAY